MRTSCKDNTEIFRDNIPVLVVISGGFIQKLYIMLNSLNLI